MNIKKIITWTIIILLSLALAITTIINPTQKTDINVKKIDSFFLTANEMKNIINKVKKINPDLTKIKNINQILEKKIIDHINLNIKIKKLGLKYTDKEIIYVIKKSSIFKKNGFFSSEKYKKYIENQKISEYILQKNIKKLLENTRVNKLLKHTEEKNIIKIKKDTKNSKIQRLNYVEIYHKHLIKNIKIKKDFIKFEKEKSENYKIPKLYKIKYTNNDKNYSKKLCISKTDINKKIFRLINKNEKLTSIKNKNSKYIIKKIKTVKQLKNKNSYKNDLINKYKKFKSKNTIKKRKNKEILGQEKIIFTTPLYKNNYIINKFKENKVIKNKNGLLILKNKRIKYINFKNTESKNNLNKQIKIKQFNLKKFLINKNQTY